MFTTCHRNGTDQLGLLSVPELTEKASVEIHGSDMFSNLPRVTQKVSGLYPIRTITIAWQEWSRMSMFLS